MNAFGRGVELALMASLKGKSAPLPLDNTAVLRTRADPLGLRFLRRLRLARTVEAAAWRTSALKADSSTSSPSRMSIARRAFRRDSS